MSLSFQQTKVLIEYILESKPEMARQVLRSELDRIKSREPEFYESVIEHGRDMVFTSAQWFDFLSKIPTHVLRRERQLMNKLSEAQREKLPPETIG